MGKRFSPKKDFFNTIGRQRSVTIGDSYCLLIYYFLDRMVIIAGGRLGAFLNSQFALQTNLSVWI
jgi:hypothetical protein